MDLAAILARVGEQLVADVVEMVRNDERYKQLAKALAEQSILNAGGKANASG